MTKGHNNVLPNNHFRKHWHSSIWSERGLVRCHFDQAGKKKRRYLARQAKAKQVAPRPTGGAVRPVVRCPTFKYNTKQRLGRGFTLDELREAGLSAKYARSIGVAVDRRRRNRDVDAFQANVQRLQEYTSKLVVLPKKGAASEAVEQLRGVVMPIVKPAIAIETRAITADEQKRRVFQEMRIMRADAKYAGVRQRKADEAAEESK
jgi:large subunit ribosomal protein L13e